MIFSMVSGHIVLRVVGVALMTNADLHIVASQNTKITTLKFAFFFPESEKMLELTGHPAPALRENDN